MSMNHAGMVRMIEPHFGKLLIFLLIEIVKDIFTFFKATGKRIFQMVFSMGAREMTNEDMQGFCLQSLGDDGKKKERRR